MSDSLVKVACTSCYGTGLVGHTDGAATICWSCAGTGYRRVPVFTKHSRMGAVRKVHWLSSGGGLSPESVSYTEFLEGKLPKSSS